MHPTEYQIDLEEAIAAANDNGKNPPPRPAAPGAKRPQSPKRTEAFNYLFKHGGLTAYTLTHLENWPEERWLIANVVPFEELMMLYGPSRIGKSFLVIDMAMSIACGLPFAGIRTERTGVLYIALEGVKGMPKRTKAWRIHHGVSEEEPAFVVTAGRLDLFSEEGFRELVQFVRGLQKSCQLKFGLIIIDTLAKAMGRGKENDNSDVTVVTLNAQQLGEIFSASVLLVHHTGKVEEAGPRGGSALTANINASIAVTKGSNGQRFLELDKMKDEDDSLRFAFTLNTVEVGRAKNGRTITSCVAQVVNAAAKAEEPKERLSPGAAKLLRVIKAAGEEGFAWDTVDVHPEFAQQWAKRRATVTGWRAELLALEEIRVEGPNRKKRLFATHPTLNPSDLEGA
jgi:hypothetical protein